MSNRFAQHLAAIAAATLIGISGAALAQPHPGHHHGPPADGDVLMGLGALKDQLNLNTSQQGMFDSAVAAAKSARESARTNLQKVHDTLVAELAKPEPDLAAVSASADEARNANAALHTQVRNAWLNLYGTFTPDQKNVVKAALQKRVARMEQFRQKMEQRRQGS
jgi:Spy/CpxP family protein refolding chaperone